MIPRTKAYCPPTFMSKIYAKHIRSMIELQLFLTKLKIKGVHYLTRYHEILHSRVNVVNDYQLLPNVTCSLDATSRQQLDNTFQSKSL